MLARYNILSEGNEVQLQIQNRDNCAARYQESLNAPFLNGLFSSGFSRCKTAP